MGVYERHGALVQQPAQRQEGDRVDRSPHPDRVGGETSLARLGEQAATGLCDEVDRPPVLAQPARLGQDPDLLPAEARGGLGVQDDTWGGGYQRLPEEPPGRPPP